MSEPQTGRLTIIICTYNRHGLLRQVLDSVARLEPAPRLEFSVLVVDNSSDGNALPLIGAMEADMPFELSGISAHPANISVARNAGVAAATSEFVAFVDDDQQLDTGWLRAVEQALDTFPHDVLFGCVAPVHEQPDRADEMANALFSRHVEGPAGKDLYAMGRNKTAGVALGSGNTIFRRGGTLTDDQPFDPAFGNGGGEDYDLFCRLQRRGKRFGWAPAVKAYEFVPAARCEPDYMAARLFAGGQAFALAVSRNSSFPAVERMRQRLIALVQLCLLAPRAMLLPAGDASRRARFRYRWASLLGKLTFRELKPIYREQSAA